MWMTFLSSTSDSAAAVVAPSPVCPSGVETFAGAGASTLGSGVDAGVGPGTTSCVARIREIGGSTVRFTFSSSAVRFARGFASSISETVSARDLGAGLGGGVSTAAGFGLSILGSVFTAGVAARGLLGGAAVDLAGALVCLRLGAAALWETAAEDLRAGADLRAVVLPVVFVAIVFF